MVLSAMSIAFTAAMLTSPAAKAGAVGICKCDQQAGILPACKNICEEAASHSNFPRPAVYFGTDETVCNAKQPLNGTSLKFLYIPKPTRKNMEDFRQFLETNRKNSEKMFKAYKHSYKIGHVGPEEFREAEKIRDEALVNYHHGMRVYLNTPSPR